jgi:hypothetical protein
MSRKVERLKRNLDLIRKFIFRRKEAQKTPLVFPKSSKAQKLMDIFLMNEFI